MDRAELTELHFITTIENVPSILRLGILSHRRAVSVKHESMAMLAIQERRRSTRVPAGRPLHEYANLYINARNKMMFKVMKASIQVAATVVRVSAEVLDVKGAVIADQNASSNHVRFAPSPRGLALIDKDTVFARYWAHPGDPIAEMRHGALVCAEVLVPDMVPPQFIIGAYVPDEPSRSQLLEVAPGLASTVKGDLFFR